MQNNGSPSVFDSKTLIAIAAVAIIYFGWNSYLQHKYPDMNKKAVAEETLVKPDGSEASKTESSPVANLGAETSRTFENVMLTYQDEKVSFTLTSLGMGIKDFTVKEYIAKESEDNIKVGVSETNSLFEFKWHNQTNPLNFKLDELSPGHFKGTAFVGDTQVIREIKYNPALGSFDNTITVLNPTEDFKNGFKIGIPESIHNTSGGSFFFPDYEMQDFFVIHDGGKSETVNFNKTDAVNEVKTNIAIAAVSSQYFTAAFIDKSDIRPDISLVSSKSSKTAYAELSYKPLQIKSEMVFKEVYYVGAKEIDRLKEVDPELGAVIDLGFFSFIARPLLYVMKAFYSLVGNWGWAIILLTLLVRLCVLPFNIMSFRSMKAMQKVQPLIQSIREKYKNDPVRLNQEMMAVMKQNGANPLGGCLPMFIQIPIFFALYRVISSSVELYGSPFALWIHDLSKHDPYYVLPVLMAVFMYVQQKITPTTMDPTQAKIMLYLPLVFTIFMLQLPAGLTLYMVISTLFGITQQYLMLREKKTA